MAAEAALSIREYGVRRGMLRVVDGVSLEVAKGTCVGLLGLNGAGKSSLLASVGGALPNDAGRVLLAGEEVTGLRSWDRCKRGLVLVPAGRQLFASMSVADNLLVGAHLRSRREIPRALDHVYSLFPVLAKMAAQAAGTLSGGQQQMLAIGRGLMADPKVLLLDEPSEGLAPVIVEQMFTIIRQLRDEGSLAILLAEQNAGILDVCDEVVVMTDGRVAVNPGDGGRSADDIARFVMGG